MNQLELRNANLLRDRALKEVVLRSRSIVRALQRTTNSQGNHSKMVAALCLGRLIQSFRSAASLLRRRYTIEAAAIMRLIVEQCAWAFVISKLPSERIQKTKVHQAMTEFRKRNAFAGRLYGGLSEITHINPKHLREYIQITMDEDGTFTIFSGPGHPIAATQYALLLYLILGQFGAVCEYVNSDARVRLRYLVQKNESIAVKGSFLKRAKQYQFRLDAILHRLNEKTHLNLIYTRGGSA